MNEVGGCRFAARVLTDPGAHPNKASGSQERSHSAKINHPLADSNANDVDRGYQE